MKEELNKLPQEELEEGPEATSEETESQQASEQESVPVEAHAQDEASQEEGEEASPESPDKKDKVKVQKTERLLDKARRENYRYQAMIQELQNQLAREMEDKERLRHLSEVSTNTAMGHYESAATEKLSRARELYQSALDSGDPKSIAEATSSLAKATYEHEKVLGMKAEQEFAQQNRAAEQKRLSEFQQQMQMNQGMPAPQLSEENWVAANSWVDNNDWFKQGSPNFDYNKFMVANQFIHNLDAYCRQNGMNHMIGSKDYFDTLDEQMGKWESQYYSQNQPMQQTMQQQNVSHSMQENYQSSPQRQPVRSMVAPARAQARMNTNGSAQAYRKVALTQEEKDFARIMKMSEDQYRKRKLESMKDDIYKDQFNQGM